ncbi:hypothetical protein LTR36_009190 [Oleoguttula mirabilis]|uniref:Myb-like domain-containing protein n=1 Tax=Oleoguttula mirabilis TaxID=1507867 RepID=A0AAV9J6D9_9PEZI|nr:hypothetical protein LTR36_009190 [Oleoguttula mirabilis]
MDYPHRKPAPDEAMPVAADPEAQTYTEDDVRQEMGTGTCQGQQVEADNVDEHRSLELDDERGQYPQSVRMDAAAIYDAPFNKYPPKMDGIRELNLMREEYRARASAYHELEDVSMDRIDKVRMPPANGHSRLTPYAPDPSLGTPFDPAVALQRTVAIDDNRINLLLGPSMRSDNIHSTQARPDAMEEGESLQMPFGTGAHETVGPTKYSRQRGAKYKVFEKGISRYHKGLLAGAEKDGKLYRDGVVDSKGRPIDFEGYEYQHDPEGPDKDAFFGAQATIDGYKNQNKATSDSEADDPQVLVRTVVGKEKRFKAKKASALMEEERREWYHPASPDEPEDAIDEDVATTEGTARDPPASDNDDATTTAMALDGSEESPSTAAAQPQAEASEDDDGTESDTAPASTPPTASAMPSSSSTTSSSRPKTRYTLEEQLAVLQAYAQFPQHARNTGESVNIVAAFKAYGFDRDWHGIRKQYKSLADKKETIKGLKRQIAAAKS